MMKDMTNSTLTEFGVIPKANPPQSQSNSMDKEPPQVIDSSEGEISDSEKEGPESGTPELEQLVLIDSSEGEISRILRIPNPIEGLLNQIS